MIDAALKIPPYTVRSRLRTMSALLWCCAGLLTVQTVVILTMRNQQYAIWSRYDSWEYVTLTPADDELLDKLDAAGALGWEIVSARRAVNDRGKEAKYEMILKRRVRSMPSGGR